MFRYRSAVPVTTLAATLVLSAACGPAPQSEPAADADFAALQERGAEGMGVDQYASTHLFDALPDGGRIEYQYDSDDAAGIAQIRSHIQEIQVAFEAGDFSTPAFVHDQEVPGTAVMAERREYIEYQYRELPRGGELRLVTQDPQALAAIRDFMAFQRDDHQAGGVEMGAQDAAFAADMNLVHELVMNNQAITRTVVHLPNGIRTLTESSNPTIAGYIVSHVASMEQRLEAGEVFNLFSPTLPIIFEDYDRIHSEIEYTSTGVAVVQTSDDPALVTALQAHAAEVTELVDEGMMAMMRGMMQSGRQGMMGGGMRGGMHQMPAPPTP